MTRRLALTFPLLILAAVVTLAGYRSAFGSPAAAWVETWASTDAWHAQGQHCWTAAPGKLTMHCQSAGLITNQTWSRTFPITVTVRVSATAAPGSSNHNYWAGVTIYDATSGDTRYGESAVCRMVPPCHYWGDHDLFVSLVDDGGFPPYATVSPSTVYTLGVTYRPNGDRAWYEFLLNGAVVGARDGQPLARDLSIFILCVSVGENTPNDGSAALCEFGPVTVNGVASDAVRSVFAPMVRTGQGYP